jgi:hypothetical protein
VKESRMRRPSQLVALVVALLAPQALIGDAYGIRSLDRIEQEAAHLRRRLQQEAASLAELATQEENGLSPGLSKPGEDLIG